MRGGRCCCSSGHGCARERAVLPFLAAKLCVTKFCSPLFWIEVTLQQYNNNNFCIDETDAWPYMVIRSRKENPRSEMQGRRDTQRAAFERRSTWESGEPRLGQHTHRRRDATRSVPMAAGMTAGTPLIKDDTHGMCNRSLTRLAREQGPGALPRHPPAAARHRGASPS